MSRTALWIRGFVLAFTDLFRLPRAFWFMTGAFVVESMAYFGALTLMVTYLSTDLGWGDRWAGLTVSFFTMLVTLLMLGAGSYAESFGLRRAMIAALAICAIGRSIYGMAPLTSSIQAVILIVGSLSIIALGEAILQPVAYSGVKQYTDERTSSMGYGLIYALMNLGIMVIGGLSSWVRPGVDAAIAGPASGTSRSTPVIAWAASQVGSGVQAVNWLCAGITAMTLIAFVVLMTRTAEGAKLRPDRIEEKRHNETRSWTDRLSDYLTEGPFANPRFIFFIFMLLPVRTLFAHQWLTMPTYILRAYSQAVGDRMEWLVNWINPCIIFVGVPIATALTRRVNVYKMMVIGSLVSAAPTFLLSFGPNLTLLITYFVVFSIGEALWSARFLEYASELAPEGRIAQYMGLASVPWLLAKGITGFYSGTMLELFCPAGIPRGELHTGQMWFIYGCIAMCSPIGLWLARRWVMAGLRTSPAERAEAEPKGT